MIMISIKCRNTFQRLFREMLSIEKSVSSPVFGKHLMITRDQLNTEYVSLALNLGERPMTDIHNTGYRHRHVQGAQKQEK